LAGFQNLESSSGYCELVNEMIVDLGDKDLIVRESPECSYAGIMDDTGGFRHPNTTKNVPLVVCRIIGTRRQNVTDA